MPSVPPEGEPAPSDGSLPASALVGSGDRPLGFYVHVPFCATRCGYCDFNTYTAAELGGAGAPPGASRDSYASAANAETRFAAGVLGGAGRPVSTVFLGGGTPTLLPPADLVGMLEEIRSSFGLVAGAEVTTESNPDSVDLPDLERLREGGINRISFGMQSSVSHVLKVLDRTHDPERSAACRGVGTAGRVRAGQPRPHLRHTGGDAGRLGRISRRGPFLWTGPHLGVRLDRGGRDRAGATRATR